MSSSSTNSGVSQITVTFDVTRDPDIAAVDVQNRVNQALGRLPAEVRQTRRHGAEGGEQLRPRRRASTPSSGEYDSLFLSNYIDVYVKDALKRVPGVADIIIFGERKYSMRVWLDPVRLAARQLTAGDVVNALREQNVNVAAGSVGDSPAPRRADLSDQRARGRPPPGAQRVREHHRQERARTARSSGCGDVGSVGARRRDLFVDAALPGHRRASASASSRCRRPTRSTCSAACRRETGAAGAVVPARPGVPHRLRHDDGRAGVDREVV